MNKLNIFFKALARSTVFYTKPVKTHKHSFEEKRERKILIISILLSNLIGVSLLGVSLHAFTLVNVGSFLGAVLCMLPSNFSPLLKCTKGIVLIALGGALGIIFSSYIVITILFFCIGLFLAGILWQFSIGEYVRFLFFSFSVVASAELRGNFQIEKVWLGLLGVLLGMMIVSLVFCVLYRERDKILSLVIDLYQELYLMAKEETSDFLNSRIKVWSILELTPKIHFRKRLWLLELVQYSDIIASELSFEKSKADLEALKYIILKLKKDSNEKVADLELVNKNIRNVIEIIDSKNERKAIKFRSLFFNKKFNNEIKKIFLSSKNSQKTFIRRLLFTGLACHLLSLLLTHVVNFPLSSHGFWIPLSGCLMVMPGYYGTFGKVTSRTIGSLIGCVCGGSLFLLLPSSGILHLVGYIMLGCLFVFLYGIIRGMSQAFLMFSVTIWLSFILGGYNAGYTRIIDVILAALITIVIIFIIPTYHDEDFNKNIENFAKIFIDKDFSKLNYKSLQYILDDLYSSQGKINASVKELQFDSSLYNLDWSLSELSDVQKIINSIIWGIIQAYYYIGSEGSKSGEIIRELCIYQERLNRLICSENRSSFSDFSINIANNEFFLPSLKKGIEGLEQIIKK